MDSILQRFGLAFALFCVVSASAVASTGPARGQTAPGFTLQDLDSQAVSLRELRDDGHVLLVFWSTQCHVCHAMMPDFKELNAQWADEGLTLAAVNVGYEDINTVQAYALENDLDFLILNDDDKKSALVEDYRLIGTPTIQLVAPDGTVLYRGHRIPDVSRYLGTEQAAR